MKRRWILTYLILALVPSAQGQTEQAVEEPDAAPVDQDSRSAQNNPTQGEMTVALGMVGSRANPGYDEARDALHAARVAVFSLDVTDVDYHTFEHGLETVSTETGGFFVRTRNRARQAIAQVADALVGHYVLFTQVPEVEPGTHAIEVDLVGGQGTVFARTRYTN